MAPEIKATATERIKQLAEKHGMVTAEIVLADARRKRSPLNPFFCWDDSIAGEEYRLIQAGQLIRRIKVEYEVSDTKSVRVRAFHHVTPEPDEQDETGRGYFVSISSALTVESYRDQIIENCKRDIASFRAKYSAINEVAHILDAMAQTNL